MMITRNVIEDLIPLYVEGEASPDTRRLVEEYAQAHPEIRELLVAGDRLPGVTSKDFGMQSLVHTRKLLDRRTQLLVWGAVLSYSVFSFRFQGGQIVFLLFRDAPWLALPFLASALVLYGLFYKTCLRLVVTGLGAPHSPPVWGLGGAVASVPFAFVASVLTGWELVWSVDVAVAAAFSAIALAVSLNRRATGSKRDIN